MKVNQVGFFRELRHGNPDGPSLEASVGKLPSENLDQVVAYLEMGEVLATTGSSVDDYLDPARREVAPLDILTDGEWVWPGDLPYYAREYGVEIPEAFVQRMRHLNWQLPELSEHDLDEIQAILMPPS